MAGSLPRPKGNGLIGASRSASNQSVAKLRPADLSPRVCRDFLPEIPSARNLPRGEILKAKPPQLAFRRAARHAGGHVLSAGLVRKSENHNITNLRRKSQYSLDLRRINLATTDVDQVRGSSGNYVAGSIPLEQI